MKNFPYSQIVIPQKTSITNNFVIHGDSIKNKTQTKRAGKNTHPINRPVHCSLQRQYEDKEKRWVQAKLCCSFDACLAL